MEIKDCVALITGGSSGLGAAALEYLVQQGARAVILDIQENKDLLDKYGEKKVIFTQADVTKEDQVGESIDKAIKHFGRINVLINCSGIGNPKMLLDKKGPMPLHFFSRVIDINLVGNFNVIRLVVEQMAKNVPNQEGERGIIINTASIGAFEGPEGQIAYAASKAGLIGMMLPMAKECAPHGIRIMTVAPGPIRTPMQDKMPDKAEACFVRFTPFPPRFGKPSEFAMLTGHIIENPMLNGECIRLDGALRVPYNLMKG